MSLVETYRLRTERRTTPLVDVHWDPSQDTTARIVGVAPMDQDILGAGPQGHITITASGVTKAFDISVWGEGVPVQDVVDQINVEYPSPIASVQMDGGGHGTLILEAPDSISVDAIDENAFACLGLQVVSVDLSVTDATSCTPHSGGQPTPGASSVPIPVPHFANTVTLFPMTAGTLNGDSPSVAYAVLWDGMPSSGQLMAYGSTWPLGEGGEQVMVASATRFLAGFPGVPITLPVPPGVTSVSLLPVAEMSIEYVDGHPEVRPPTRVAPVFSARIAFSD